MHRNPRACYRRQPQLTRAGDLTDQELVALRDFIEGNYKVEGDLRREVAADIRRR